MASKIVLASKIKGKVPRGLNKLQQGVAGQPKCGGREDDIAMTIEAAFDQDEIDELSDTFDAMFGQEAQFSYASMMTRLQQINQLMNRELMKIARRCGSGYGDFEALNSLRLMPGLKVRPTDLARLTKTTLAAATGRVHHLEAAGLVARLRNENDHRETLLSLTTAGLKLCDRMMTDVIEQAIFASALVQINQRSKERFAKDLSKLVTMPKESTKKEEESQGDDCQS